MSEADSSGTLPESRARWIRPACFVVLLALLPFTWTTEADCGRHRDLTGAQLLTDDASGFVLVLVAFAIGVGYFWILPRLTAGFRLVFETASLLLLGYFTLALSIATTFMGTMHPAGFAAVGAMFVASCDAVFGVVSAIVGLRARARMRRRAGKGGPEPP